MRNICLTLLMLLTLALGDVMNCDGSGKCSSDRNRNKMGVTARMASRLALLNSTMRYRDGTHITCDGNICAFMQNTGTNTFTTGDNMIGYAGSLSTKCGGCGSHDVIGAKGEFTINWVTSPTCQGLCPDSLGSLPYMQVAMNPPPTERLAKRENVITVVPNPCPTKGSPGYSARNKTLCDAVLLRTG